ncbi:MAG: hypothetical protein QNJ60_13630 [Xenococcaceae cyanobacterium MO_188.B19]|nr:hypothetical protein [Xenococcaceae cyanobacterium MO_188.B19]
MTHSNDNNNSDRLTRIEALVESNARAIQAMMEQQATDRLNHESRMARLEENLIQTRQLMANHDQRITLLENVSSRLTELQLSLAGILSNQAQNSPIVLQKLDNIENKVDQILDRNPE